MSSYRITLKQVRAVNPQVKTSWPVDLQVWVELLTRHPHRDWQAPFYLSPEQIRTFHAVAKASKK